MKSRLLIFPVLIGAVLAVSSCRKTESGIPEPAQGPVSLSLSFASPRASIDFGPVTRADGDGTDDFSEAVDGSSIFSLFIMLVKLDDTDTTVPDEDKDGTLVAYRALYQPNEYDDGDYAVEGDAPDFSMETDGSGRGDNGFCDADGNVVGDYKSPYATVNFNYFKPLHGDEQKSCEKLQPGRYKILAVANYRGRKDGSLAVPGIDNGQMKALIQTIKKDFLAKVDFGGIKNFLTKGYDVSYKDQASGEQKQASGLKIRDYSLDVTEGGHVCPRTTQLLTFDKVLTLAASDNFIEEQLEKTYTRLRIVVENDHPEFPLTVHSLELGTMTQSYSPLFVKPDGKGSQYLDTRVAPVMDAPNAIVKFEEKAEIPGDTKKTVFDAYLLESRFDPEKMSASDAGFWFRTVVEYEGKTYNAKYTVINRNPTTDEPVPVADITELNSWIAGSSGKQKTSKFILRTQTGSILKDGAVEDVLGSFIYADGSQVLTTPERSDIIEDPMVWEIEDWKSDGNGSNRYYTGYIHNVNGYLICPDTAAESPLVTQSRYHRIRFDNATYGSFSQGSLDGKAYDNRALNLTDLWTKKVLAIGPDPNSSYYQYPYYGWPDYGVNAANDRVHWSLYPLGGGDDIKAWRDSFKVPLKRLNADNTQTDVTEIKRGDCLTIRIIVNLNEEKRDFEFVVEPWTNGGSHDIEFE